MDELNQLILFKRNSEFFTSQEEAIQGLNLVEFHVGEPVVAIYGTSAADAKMLVAVGKTEGSGANAYELISTNQDAQGILQQLQQLQQAFNTHEDLLAEGETAGHVKDSADVTFVGGQGTVLAAGKVKNALTFSGYSNQTFDGSAPIEIALPEAGTASPVGAGTATVGTSEKWAREDHVHPAQVNVTGNAGTATKLETPVDITLTGGVTGTVNTDFSGAVKIATTLSDHNHTVDEITDLQDTLENYAPIADAHFTGTPTAPTPAAGTNTVQIATTAFVVKEISDKLAAAMALTFKGTLGTDGTIQALPAQHTVGDVYVATAGAPDINGISVEAGDMIICTKTGSAASDADWSVVQTNIDGAVTGPDSSVNGNLAIFQGTSGKVISDSGIALGDLAKTSTSVTAGEGLAGGGTLAQDVTISHAEKPATGSDTGEVGNVVTGILIDKFGHVSGATKANLNGTVSAGAGKYISSITLNGTTLEGTTADLPKVTISGAEEVEGEFISSLSIAEDGYSILATKKQIEIPEVPDIEVTGGEVAEGQYVSSISASGHTITVQKATLPEESGKVKVDTNGTADFLEAKIVSGQGNSANNVYPVQITKDGDQLKVTVKIDVIDGGTY